MGRRGGREGSKRGKGRASLDTQNLEGVSTLSSESAVVAEEKEDCSGMAGGG